MEDHSSDRAQWRATVIVLLVSGVVLGAEQILPMSDTFRSQIGVLTVLLTFGFWHMLVGAVGGRGS